MEHETVRKLLNDEMTPLEHEKVFESIGLDGHKSISFEEYEEAMLISMNSQSTQMLEAAFHVLDINGDNQLDFDELVGSMKANAAAFDKIKGHNFVEEMREFIDMND